MSQYLIKKQLIEYLKLKIESIKEEIQKNASDRKRNKKIKELQTHIEVLEKKLTKGHCFGFSICDAALTAEGYEDWWHQILYLVANWDKHDVNALDDEVDLSSYLPDSHQSNDNRPTTLGDLFEIVSNYILLMQSSIFENLPFVPSDISQRRLMEADNPFFEILINKEIKRIEHQGSETVHVNDLARFLDENKNAISGNMCLLHSEDHTITVRYLNEQWGIYNSNYNHTSVDTMVKKFDTVEQLVEEVKIKNKHCVSIDVMSLCKNKKISLSHYYSPTFTEAQIFGLLEPSGLYLMNTNSLHTLEQFLECIDGSEGELRENIFNAFAQAIEHKLNEKTILDRMENTPKEVYSKMIDVMVNSKNDILINAAIVSQIKIIIDSEDYWKTKTHSPVGKFPRTITCLQWMVYDNKSLGQSHLLDKFKELTDKNINYRKNHPIMYALNWGNRHSDTEDFYKILSDLPKNKNEARERVNKIFKQVVALHETNKQQMSIGRK